MTVHSQSDDIDQVENSVVESSERVRSGLDEFVEAHRIATMERQRKRKAAFASLAAIFAFVVVLFVLFGTSAQIDDANGGGTPEP